MSHGLPVKIVYPNILAKGGSTMTKDSISLTGRPLVNAITVQGKFLKILPGNTKTAEVEFSAVRIVSKAVRCSNNRRSEVT